MEKSIDSPPKINKRGRWQRVLALTLVANLLLTSLCTIFNVQPVQADYGSQFVCSGGTQWRVLAVDTSGNRLIISERVFGMGTQFNTSNTFVRWHNMTTTQPIRTAMNNFWDNNVGSELKALALPANNLNNDVRTGIGGLTQNENAAAGWTSAGTGTPNATNALFILSISEVNRYGDGGSLNRMVTSIGGTELFWWLRSPGNSNPAPVSSVGTSGYIAVTDATVTDRGIRPALWIKSENGGGGDLPTWMQNSPTPITFPNTPTQLPPHLLNSPTPITFPNTPTQLPPHLLNSPTPITFPATPTQLPPHLLNSPTPITFPNTPTQLPPHLLNSPTPITFVPTNTPLPGHLLTPKVAHNANG